MSKFSNGEYSYIPEGWGCKRLIDCTIDGNISYGIVQPGQHQEDGISIIRVNNVNNGQLDLTNILKVSPDIESKYKRTRLKGGEVLLTLVGSTGQSFVAPLELAGWNVPRAIAVIKVDDDVGAEWVNICLQSNETKHFLNVRANTTVQKTLNLKDVRDVPILIPPKCVKESIQKNKLSLDNKIELNRQINQTLESMAQAIFKSWFVDFDPVKAKIAALEAGEDAEGVTRAAMRAISGKTDDELDKMEGGQLEDYAKLKTTAELFPAAMQDSELGEVPEGWKISTIGEEVGVVGGGTPSTKNPEFWEGGEIHWTTPKDLSNLTDKVLLTTERKITETGLKKVSSGLLPVNTVLMSSRAPVGYLALAKVPVAVNQGYIAMICEQCLSPEFVIQWCNSVMTDIKQRSSGTTFAEISKKNFKIIPVLVSSEEVQQSYSKLVSDFYDKITEIAIESLTLIDIRDSLLPKLLSGEVTIQGCVFE